MLQRLFSWFENRIDPYPDSAPTAPAATQAIAILETEFPTKTTRASRHRRPSQLTLPVAVSQETP